MSHLAPSSEARLATPFGVLAIHADNNFVTGIEFLPKLTPVLPPRRNSLAHLACVQLNAYFDDANFSFDLPLKLVGSAHQIKVWEALKAIPRGQVLSYGELAARVASAPRAIGQACGRNPLPVVVPCHRVIAAGGAMGGFMGGRNAAPLAIKRWLLRHEGYAIDDRS
ncbi:MAG: methylated-DNA--[protein]-cysteine S-methyltransferase [Burkholderiales bacterium]|nr:methylated-DNA--[protein]-cysteine S-methyltransferase [Burkholderiales bacterium]